jgi:hypothetical protein
MRKAIAAISSLVPVAVFIAAFVQGCASDSSASQGRESSAMMSTPETDDPFLSTAKGASDEALQAFRKGAFDPFFVTARAMLEDGRQTFRKETFGDEAFWGDTLQLHKAIGGAALGGVGPGVSPKTALTVGLKVDVESLPRSLLAKIKAGQVNLDDPATTVALLKLDAVVGVAGRFDASGNMASIGIECAFCHSTVDDSFAPGIGRRLDGWANRDLNVDAAVFLDGKAFRPDGRSAATLIPPAFGLAGVNLHTFTGWGSVTYWNAFVANLEMHGQGTFYDPRLNAGADAGAPQFPIAVKSGAGNVRNMPDLITPKLANLQLYQLAIPAPTPPAGSFDSAAADRGKALFGGTAKCATCHVPPLFTEPGYNMHTAAEIGIDDFQAKRSPDQRYRTTPLRGLFSHMKGGFYHDGRFPTLGAVVDHYDSLGSLGLTAGQKSDLVEYLKSL